MASVRVEHGLGVKASGTWVPLQEKKANPDPRVGSYLTMFDTSGPAVRLLWPATTLRLMFRAFHPKPQTLNPQHPRSMSFLLNLDSCLSGAWHPSLETPIREQTRCMP